MWIAILGFVAALTPGAAPAQSKVAAAPTCCFTNARYAGVCSVAPAEGESCASVFAYLNGPQSQGKTYCASTNVRGGWKQRKCAPVKNAATPSPTVH